MIIVLKKQDKEKELKANNFDDLKYQIISHYFIDFIKQGKSIMEAYRLAGLEVGLSSARIRQIIETMEARKCNLN